MWSKWEICKFRLIVRNSQLYKSWMIKQYNKDTWRAWCRFIVWDPRCIHYNQVTVKCTGREIYSTSELTVIFFAQWIICSLLFLRFKSKLFFSYNLFWTTTCLNLGSSILWAKRSWTAWGGRREIFVKILLRHSCKLVWILCLYTLTLDHLC